MAKFTAKKQQDIQVQRGFTPDTPDTSKADLIKGLGASVQAGISEYKAVKGRRLQDELVDEAQKTAAAVTTVKDALAISKKKPKETFDARTGTVNLIEDAPEDFSIALAEVMNVAGRDFRAIASAVAQGSTPEHAAAVMLESKLKEHMARNPAFAPELRQAVQQHLPYDPTGFQLKQILSIPKTTGKLTPEQHLRAKAEHAAKVISREYGEPVDADFVEGIFVQSDFSKQKMNIDAHQVQVGKRSVSDFIGEYVAGDADFYSNAFLTLAEQIKAGGGDLPPGAQRAAFNFAKQEKFKTISSELSRKGLWNAEASKLLNEQLAQQFDPLLKAVEDNDVAKLLQDKNVIMMERAKEWGWDIMPDFMKWANALPEGIATKAFDQGMRFTDPKALAKLNESYPVLAQAFRAMQGLDEDDPQKVSTAKQGKTLMKLLMDVQLGKEISPEGVKLLQAAEESLFFSPGVDPALREKYFETLGKTEARGVGFLAQPNRRTTASPIDVNFMKREWKETVPALVNSISQEMVENPDFNLVVTPEGKLQGVIKRGKQNQRPINIPEVTQLQYFINAAKHGWDKDFGTTSGNVMKELTSQITQTAENLEGTEAPGVLETVGTSIKETVSDAGKSIADAVKNYEDIVNGRVKPKDPNKAISEALGNIKKLVDKMPTEFKGENIEE